VNDQPRVLGLFILELTHRFVEGADAEHGETEASNLGFDLFAHTTPRLEYQERKLRRSGVASQ